MRYLDLIISYVLPIARYIVLIALSVLIAANFLFFCIYFFFISRGDQYDNKAELAPRERRRKKRDHHHYHHH